MTGVNGNQPTECIICAKPLGADSRNEGYIVCHEHRKCVVCKENLTARECHWCADKYEEDYKQDKENPVKEIKYDVLEIIHARCYTLRHSDSLVKITQTEFDYLNLIRLMIEPDLDIDRVGNENAAYEKSARFIANMSFEQQQLHLSRIQACVAQVQNAINLNPLKKKESLNEREKEKFTRAKREALTSSRPDNKTPEDSEELQLGHFMEVHGVPERKLAIEYMKRQNKQVRNLRETLKISEQEAIAMVTGMMIKGGFYKK